MTYKYALIDTANTFFRARHVASRNSTLEEKIGMALHLTLASVNQAVRRYGIDHVVFCLEGKSWRKAVYGPYKRNRIVDAMSVTEAEAEENKIFWETYQKFTNFIKEKTNVSVLRHPEAEADDMIARFIALHPEDTHYIISTDTDFDQLITDKVSRYSGVANELVTINGVFKDNGKPVIDKKTKQPKLLEDPEYGLFKKLVRGDSSDNVFASYPGAREKGTKNKVGIKEAFEDRNKQGFAYNNFMLQRFVDHNDQEVRVKDAFERNRLLIDLTAQPQEMKDAFDDCIRNGVRRETTPQVGIHFMKFCGKYDLQKISESAETYSRWLNEPYTGKLEEAVNV
jgi:5'-3' exonuclease